MNLEQLTPDLALTLTRVRASCTYDRELNRIGSQSMNSWRVSKYDPRRRSADGSYPAETWTSVSDIGRVFDKEEFTVREYLAVEDSYVRVATQFHQDAGCPIMFARGVETADCEPRLDGRACLAPPTEGTPVEVHMLTEVIRACLREVFWCRLESAGARWQIHFGYDYYMYLIGDTLSDILRGLASRGGLFIEAHKSPCQER
ncbi:MAG: hypothetical protein U0271_15020 [Polyangiaceae bacterium]